MKHASSRRLYDYWSLLRGHRSAPDRSEIDPAHIRDILPDTFILEVTDRAEYIYRLAGTRICSSYCRELKERSFLSLWRDADIESLRRMLDGVRSDGAVAVIGVRGRNERGQETSIEITLLPLSYGGKSHNRILGSHANLDAPYWLGIYPVVSHEITSLRLIWPDETPSHLRQRSQEELDAIPALLPIMPQARRGHLLVYEGGKN
ncbi:MAG: PAS domain-containing protein [Hyphomicrobiales bacterium]